MSTFFKKKGGSSGSNGGVGDDGQELTSEQRRRLSVGQVDKKEKADWDAANQGRDAGGDRGQVRLQDPKTRGKDILELANIGQSQMTNEKARRGSFTCSSVTSADQDSFEDKKRVGEATGSMLAEIGVGIKCKKGFKPEAPNQDSFCFAHVRDENQKYDLYGVFDGHGVCGHDVSNFARDEVPKYFLVYRNEQKLGVGESIRRAFASTQRDIEEANAKQQLNATTSGTTATFGYKDANTGEIVVGHCGDSRCILVYLDKKGQPRGIELCADHKPNLPEEKARIEAGGGCVIFDGFYNHRVFKKGTVYPGLNMSRAMGDIIGHREAGITELADIMYVPTSKDMCGKGQGNPEYTEAEAAKDAGFNGGQNTFFKKHSHDCVAMIMASDGVWEFIDNDEAAKICCAQRDKDTGKIDPNRAAEALSKESWNRWMEDTNGEISDDITCIVQTL